MSSKSNKSVSILKKIFLYGLLVIAVCFISARIYFALTDDFRVGNITYEVPYKSFLEIDPEDKISENELNSILDQPYSYIGKGAQSYVFGSADDKYVIKFFKFKHLKPSIFWEWMPSIGPLKTYKDKLAARKQRKLLGVFRAHKLAYDVDRAQSGLVFIQLNISQNPRRSVTVINKMGMKVDIDLEHIPFILQKKGVTLRSALTELLDKYDLDTVEKRVGQIFEMYANEYAMGIYDHDHGVMRNTGFIDDKPLHLDVGKLAKKSSMLQKKFAREDADIVTKSIKQWLNKNYPKEYQILEPSIDQQVEHYFPKPS